MGRTLRRVFFASVLCGAAAVCVAGRASPSPLGGGKLVLVGASLEDGGQAGLYVMNADGSGLRQITHRSSDEQPHWSRDGGSIAFVRAIGLSGRVMVVRSDGSAPRSLGSSPIASLAAPDPWSPDGKRIAWGGCGGLCVFDLASSRRTGIPLGSRDDLQGFSWSPDGRKLVAVDQSRGLVVVDLSGKQLTVLAKQGEFPAWSPDGKQVAFLAGTRQVTYRVGSKLEIVPAAGGRARVVARYVETAPRWSRDGHRLLYTDFIRHPVSFSVRVVNVVTHTNTRVDNTGGIAFDGIARWSPDGSTIAYGRVPVPVGERQDIWLAQANGGGLRQLTGEFPTGLGYSDLDWTSGSVPAGPPVPPPDLLQLTATSELKFGYLDGPIAQAGASDSVAYRTDASCDADGTVLSATLNVWTPSTGNTVTTSAPCEDFAAESYAVTSNLDAWVSQPDLNGNETLAVMRPGTTRVDPIAKWPSGQEAPDIGWQSEIDRIVGDGSQIVFESRLGDGTPQLWRLVDGAVPHAAQIPLPSDATDLIDANAGRIIVLTADKNLAVLTADGTLLSRIADGTPLSRIASFNTVRIGGDTVGIADGNKLRVYATDRGTLRYQLPLAHTSGVPRLLTIGDGYAVYASGIELHLLRLDNGNDHIVNLPAQAGPLQALITTNGLFVAYFHGYDTYLNGYYPQAGRIMFVPAANLP